ncbi:hypothetical protein [Streptacidiphilus fuscans]|uniref:Uncharacterized protein n=1 Tax=Streptacidiphilus fuscans TaxID=2789292 RepID=A0A931BA36_9ACTN|nr:hypothetical protein [Streptacidiphilus fuscans]MBF9072836.1 hypothetical protein [Streptacidiphilus fuscans]
MTAILARVADEEVARVTRRNWEAGLSCLAVAGFVVQGVVITALLGIAAVLLHSHGWFSEPHDRALLWDDTAAFIGLLCGAPLIAFLVRKRSSEVGTGILITVAAFVILLALRPSSG